MIMLTTRCQTKIKTTKDKGKLNFFVIDEKIDFILRKIVIFLNFKTKKFRYPVVLSCLIDQNHLRCELNRRVDARVVNGDGL